MHVMKIGLYLCECSGSISEKLNLHEVRNRIIELFPDLYVRIYNLLCSGEDLAALSEDIRKERPERVVIAACSPRDRESQFRRVIEEAGLNPYLLQMVNIREQTAWVTPDYAAATAKAFTLVAAAIARVRLHQPLDRKTVTACTDVMVIGAGPAGLSAALALADAGRNVILVEKSAAAGGMPISLYEIFPYLECGPCLTAPIIDDALHNEHEGRIELLTLAQINSVRGYFGNFIADIRAIPRYVSASSCIGCGECVAACPVSFSCGQVEKKAIDFHSPGALPHVPVLDMEQCLRSRNVSCVKCRDACPVEGVIDYDDKERTVERKVGAIIVATGASLLDCSVFPRLGYGSISDVVTAHEFERLISSDGPGGGKLFTSSGSSPLCIGIIHCVGSLDPAHKSYCSSICCRYALKYSAEIRRRHPETEIYHFIKEWCLPGQSATGLFRRAQEDSSTNFIRYDDLSTFEVSYSAGGNSIYFREAAGSLRNMRVDMIVLCPALVPAPGAAELADILGANVDENGFFVATNEPAGCIETSMRGIFSAGTCRMPMDISSSINDGHAAAGCILAKLKPGGLIDISPEIAIINAHRCTGCMLCKTICPYKAIVTSGSVEGKAEVVMELCRGCGICAASCPARAIECMAYSYEEVTAEIETILRESVKKRNQG